MYSRLIVAHLSQATAQVTLAPPACQSSATGETIQWAAPQLVSAASRNPVKTESPDLVQLFPNTQSPLATHRAHQYEVRHPLSGSIGEFKF